MLRCSAHTKIEPCRRCR